MSEQFEVELGEYRQAAQDLNRVLEINPQDVKAHVNRGMVYCRQGQYQQAIEHFTQAIEYDNRLAVAYSNRAYAHII